MTTAIPNNITGPEIMYGALEETVYLLATRMPEDEVKILVKGIDPRRTELYIKGLFVDPPMCNDELRFASVARWCEREYGSQPLGVVAVIEQVQLDIQEGRILH